MTDSEEAYWKSEKDSVLKRIYRKKEEQDVAAELILSNNKEAERVTSILRCERDTEQQLIADAVRYTNEMYLEKTETYEEECRLDLWEEEMLEIIILGQEFRIFHFTFPAKDMGGAPTNSESAISAPMQYSETREMITNFYWEQQLRQSISADQNNKFMKHLTSYEQSHSEILQRETEAKQQQIKQQLQQAADLKAAMAINELRSSELAFQEVSNRLQRLTNNVCAVSS